MKTAIRSAPLRTKTSSQVRNRIGCESRAGDRQLKSDLSIAHPRVPLMNALRDRHRSYMSSARKRFASERNIKNIGGKHCQTLIQVKFTRAYLAVEESSRRFGTAGDLVTPPRINSSRGGRGRRIGPSRGAGNPAPGCQCEGNPSRTSRARARKPRSTARRYFWATSC